ncbi:MAG: M48 family metallopeptidase [Ignavibacteria bacterium]
MKFIQESAKKWSAMELSYRKVKYPRLEFRTGELIMILPHGKKPEDLLIKYSGWIKEKELFIKRSLEAAKKKKLNKRDLNGLKKLVQSFIDEYSEELGVHANRISYREMKSKWGSCSNFGNLMFNPDMKYLPKKLISYIVFHELTHMISRKHNAKFWEVIKTKFKDHEEIERELFEYWFGIKTLNN